MTGCENVQAVLFDLYNTLIEVETDEESMETYRATSAWLAYEGVEIDPETLKAEYRRLCREHAWSCGETYPEVHVERVFREICRRFCLWDIDEKRVGRRAARTFRAASLRKKRLIQGSRSLLEYFADRPLGIVSNGQRVFSERELRHLGIRDYFDVVVFSSDYGYKKPDPRLFRHALHRLGVHPENTLFIGDSYRNDILGPRRIGMQAMFIREARELAVR